MSHALEPEQAIKAVTVEDNDYEVFISYRHKRADGTAVTEAEELYVALRDYYGITAFRDQEELHFGDFRKQLIRYNKRSRCLVLLLTPGALDRCKVTTDTQDGGDPATVNGMEDWVSKEISLFLRRHKPIIPVVFPGFEWPEQEELPKELHKLLKLEEKAIYYLNSAYVAREVHDELRKFWSRHDQREAIHQRYYITRHYREKTGSYFYESAMRFRKALLFFALVFWFCSMVFEPNFTISKNQDGWAMLFSPLSVWCFFLDVKKDVYYGEDVTMIDKVLDAPMMDWFDMRFWGTLIIALITYFGGLFLNIITALFAGDDQAAMLVNSSVFLICSLVRFGHRLLWSTLHLLNSLLSPYPQVYLRKKIATILERIFGVAGWVLLLPAMFVIAMVTVNGL